MKIAVWVNTWPYTSLQNQSAAMSALKVTYPQGEYLHYLPMIFRSSAWSQHWPFAFLAPTLILYWGSSTHSNQAQWSFLLLKRQSVWKPKILPELWGKLLLYLIISLVKHMIIWLGNYQCAMCSLIATVIRKIHTHNLCHKNFRGSALPQWNEEVTVIRILISIVA